MLVFCWLALIFWCLGVGKSDDEEEKEEYKPKPAKVYTETGGDDAENLDFDDNEKPPIY